MRRRLRDALSRAYRRWYNNLPGPKQRRPDFDEGGILEVLRSAKVMDNHIIALYRECLRPRHWVGHGRNWDKPLEIDRLDPDEVYDRCAVLLRAIP